MVIVFAALFGAPDAQAGAVGEPTTAVEQRLRPWEHDALLEAAAAIDAFSGALQAKVCRVFERRDSATRLLLILLTQGPPAFCLHDRRRAHDVGPAVALHSAPTP